MRRIVLIGLLLILVVAACGPEPVDNPRVLLVGDSLLYSVRTPVDTTLREAGWEPVVGAVPGSRIEDWPLLTASAASAQQPAIAVVELGTNNCTLKGVCSDLQARIDQLMAMLDSVDVVLWLNVQEDVPLTANAEFVNAELERAAERWPKMKIVDFNGDFEDDPTLNSPDGVHLSAEGMTALTNLIVDALEPYYPSE